MLYETPIIETSRLILKRGTLEDYQKVYEYDFTKLRNINGEFEFKKQDLKQIEGFEQIYPESYDWIIYLKDSNEPLGNVIADREQKDIRSIELSFNTHPNYWNNGYTTEALIEIMKYLFSEGYENILCSYAEGNFKSKRLAEKLGFSNYKVIENSWEKDGISISTYVTIISREKFDSLYKNEKCYK